ncbi:hypothetical protein [Geopseudomonas aromaticivorans]
MSEPVVYDKGDMRRLLAVLAAIAEIPDATLVKVVARTGIDKKSVTFLIEQAVYEAGVVIDKDGAVYRIQDWGAIAANGARKALLGTLGLSGLRPGKNKEPKGKQRRTPKDGPDEAGLWTVVRFPDGEWSSGGSPDDPDYVDCEVFQVEAPSRDLAVRRARARRSATYRRSLLK